MKLRDYKKAVEKLNLYAHHYYVLDDPITTDEVYDKLYHEVVEYEESNKGDILSSSPTQRVGDVISSGFTKASHLSRMWSLEDIFDSNGLRKMVKQKLIGWMKISHFIVNQSLMEHLLILFMKMVNSLKESLVVMVLLENL